MSHSLTFSRIQGEFAQDKETIGQADPYVVFSTGSQKTQTKAIKGVGAGTAEWRETYTLNEFSPNSSTTLEVVVYNHNTLRPDGTIGSGTVDLSSLGESQLSGSGDRVSVPLTDKKGTSVGTLSFIVHGGGYSGSGSRGTTGSGHHTGSGVAGAAGGAAGVGHHGTHGHHGHHTGSGTGGTVTGVGAGSDYGTAKTAADRAAAENRDVTVEGRSGEVGAGRPTNVGTGHHHHHHAGTGTGVTDTTRGAVGTGPGEVIDRKYYTGVEDRPQEQALVEQFREHNPYAKQYETTVQHTGRERLVGSSIEALGTTERVVGQDHHVHAHPHDHIARALPKGAVADRPGGEGWVQGKPGPVCDSTTFEVTGDRTVDKERVTNLREHREFEKEFEVKTALKGERNLERGAETEQLNRERVLLDEKNKNACEGHPGVDAAGNAVHGTTGSSLRGATGTGTGTGVTSGTTGSGYDNTTGTGSGYGSGTGAGSGATTGTGSGYGTGTGVTSGTSGYGTGTGATGTGSGYGSGAGATSGTSGYGTGTGATGTGSGYGTSGSTGTGYGSGTGTGTGTTGQGGITNKLASFVPGTEANKEKKAAQGQL